MRPRPVPPGAAALGPTSGARPRRAFGLEVYLDRRIIAILLLGFSSGLPLLLILRTLSAWLADAGVDITTIGLFGFVLAPYTFKFVWAPFIDRLPLPWLTRRFGRRRGWLLLTQACLMAAIFGLGQTDPTQGLAATALLAVLVAFCSASQDIVVDAYRIEILDEAELGAGAANVVTGYRLGMWVAAAGALFLADRIGWSATYTAMALLVLVGVTTVLLSPEPPPPELDPDPEQAAPDRPAALPSRRRTGYLLLLAACLGLLIGLLAGGSFTPGTGVAAGLASAAALAALFLAFGRQQAFRQAVIDPFRDFFRRHGVRVAIVILTFISLFKASDVLLTLVANPFYLEIGFSKSQIAWVSGTLGFLVTFLGAYLAGLMIYRLGIAASLWISGVLMMASNLMFALQAWAGANYPLFHATILAENIAGGMGTTAFVAYLAALCNRRYTAVQYALLTSFMQMLGKYLIVPGSGFLVAGLGWFNFFVLSSLAGLPALVLLWWLGRHMPAGDAPTAQRP